MNYEQDLVSNRKGISMGIYEDHCDKSAKARDEFWATIGEVNPDVISHLANPGLMGGPKWPSLRQAYKVVHGAETTILASDGLSDPYFDMETNEQTAKYNGLGLEFYIEIPGSLSMEEATKSWQFQALFQVCQNAAHAGNFINAIEKFKHVSLEVYDIDVTEEFKGEKDQLGVLMGLESDKVPSRVKLSLEEIQVVNIKALTKSELACILEEGKTGRDKLVDAFLQDPTGTISSLDRKSVV